GVAAFELGDMETATRSLDALIELAQAEDDAEMLAPAANNLGAIADLQGRVEEALSYYRLALPLYEQADRPHGVAQIHHNLGLSYRELNRIGEAVRCHVKAVEVAEGVGYRPLVALSLSARAECELARGDQGIAAELADRSIQISRACEDPVSEGDALRVRGVVRCRRGDLEGALADLAAATELAGRTGNSLLHAESLRDQGRCLSQAGRPGEARALLLRAVTGFVELGAVAKADAIARELDD
ncbi:MAG: tetratricopeptide repeat protein, partial [Gemmatimonadota bacterium]